MWRDIYIWDRLEGQGQVLFRRDELQAQSQLRRVGGWRQWSDSLQRWSNFCAGGPAPYDGGPAACAGRGCSTPCTAGGPFSMYQL